MLFIVTVIIVIITIIINILSVKRNNYYVPVSAHKLQQFNVYS
jgi:hypothetical protein